MKIGTMLFVVSFAGLGLVARAEAAITGSYVTMNLCLDAAGWTQEFAAMKRAGYDTVMLAGVYDADERLAYYGSSEIAGTSLGCEYDELEALLAAADTHGFSVYVGPLSSDCDLWDSGNPCIDETIALHRDVAREVHGRYKSRHASFKGWYIRQEVALNDIVESGVDIGALNFQKQVSADLDAIGASPLPILAPPYFAPREGPGDEQMPLTPAQIQSALASYLQAVPRLDIIALQDGVGVGNVELDEVDAYFSAARQAVAAEGKVMWGGIENFEYAGPDAEFEWRPTRTPTFFADMDAVAPHVAKQVTWIFNQHQSPQSARFPLEAPRLNAEYAADRLVPTDWTAGRRYTLSVAPSPTYPDSGSELTDGTLGTPASWTPWLGWAGLTSPLTVTMDLGQLREIKVLRALAQTGTSSAIAFPTAFTAEVSNDGVAWRRFGWGSGFAAETSDTSTDWSAISGYDTARHVRFRFTPADGQWLFLSELDVKGGGGRRGYPLAVGKAYTVSPAPASRYPDNGSRLTDGAAGMTFSEDPARNGAAGWLTGSSQVSVTATVDLGASYSIASARVNTGAGEWGLGGGSDYRATNVAVYTSTNGSSFTQRGSSSQPGSWMGASFSAVSARYVRFVVTKTYGGFGKDWLFIGDLEVLGQ